MDGQSRVDISNILRKYSQDEAINSISVVFPISLGKRNKMDHL